MPHLSPADVTSKHLESAGQVRAIQSVRRSATESIGTSVGGGYVRYVGRVGALAVALGVGTYGLILIFSCSHETDGIITEHLCVWHLILVFQ